MAGITIDGLPDPAELNNKPIMNIGITRKLFLAVLATVIFAVMIVGVATRWSFNRGFLGYLNELAVERMEFVTARVGQAYAEHGNWDFMRDQPEVWFGLLRPVVGQELTTDALPGSNFPTSDLTGAFLRLGLVDAQQQWVAGYREIDVSMQRRPVMVNGNTVGWVILASFQSVTDAGNLRFQENQFRAILLASLIAVALAALIALWLARTLLAPVRRVAEATHHLAAGRYETRVNVASHDEVGQLAADFNHLAQTLQRNESVRRDFMADVSHELRTPLAVLRGELEAIEDGVRAVTPTALHSLQNEVATLSQLVDDLYELSLSDAGALAYRLHELDLGELLTLAVDSMRIRFAQQELRIELQLPSRALLVNADEARLRQLFHNVLENSLRYTDSGGQLRIGVQETTDWLQVDFQDSAPGVAAEMLPRLFERFFRSEGSRSRSTGGAGIGLAICRNIAEAHGGTIEALASPFGGLWIAVRLPRSLPRMPG
jgi:two-component system, OmpR family, sensor histidine kinase BaeS